MKDGKWVESTNEVAPFLPLPPFQLNLSLLPYDLSSFIFTTLIIDFNSVKITKEVPLSLPLPPFQLNHLYHLSSVGLLSKKKVQLSSLISFLCCSRKVASIIFLSVRETVFFFILQNMSRQL